MNTPLQTLLDERKAAWLASDTSKRIEATELFAINHGFPEWDGTTVSDFLQESILQGVRLGRETMLARMSLLDHEASLKDRIEWAIETKKVLAALEAKEKEI